ncbi:MAG TPA: hypothetical protein VLT16_13755, partial [Candidatus Limnocylindrales bacterium]|nr:hypothetical protein [Candidatus Limnocylindrales bacterium]
LKIGFVTSAQHRSLTADDLLLADAISSRGGRVFPIVWTEVRPKLLDCDLLLLRSCWDYHLYPERFAAWVEVAGRHSRLINPAEIVLWNMDKKYLGDIAAAGFAVPRTITLEAGTQPELPKLFRAAGFSTAVIKPAISLSAFETYLVRSEEAPRFEDKVKGLLQDRAVLVQEFIPEIASQGEWSLIFAGGVFTHAVRKLPSAGDFRVQNEYGGSAEIAQPAQELLETASSILARFAPQALYCRADMVPTPRGPVLMELELIDPVLHFALAPAAAARMAELLLK